MTPALDKLTPFERWMVKSNLQTIKETGVTVEVQVSILRANGYNQVADGVAEAFELNKQEETNA